MEIALRVIVGVAVGAGLGLLAGGIPTCSSGACSPRAARTYSLVAGAVFGAGVALYTVGR